MPCQAFTWSSLSVSPADPYSCLQLMLWPRHLLMRSTWQEADA